MDDLRIPMGINAAGELVDPLSARKDESYFCPACRSLLVLRQGTKKVFHFAHKTDCECNQETVIHKTAKILIKQVVEKWKKGGNSPIIRRSCSSCPSTVDQPLPGKVERAEEEYRVDNFVADIALLGSGIPLAAIEIRVTHAVEEVKQRKLPIPFIELDGEAVVKDPYIWRPTFDKFNAVYCEVCKEYQKKVTEIGKRSNVSFSKDFYRPAISKCYKCKQDILVFTWPKHGIFPKDKPVQQPFPRTIQFRYSKTLEGKYWANTCPFCNAIQGDHFLFREVGGAFYGEAANYCECGEPLVTVESNLSVNQILNRMFGGSRRS